MFPHKRLRRLRRQKIIPLLAETHIGKDDLIAPLFFDENIAEPVPILAMPGQNRWPVSMAAEVVTRMRTAGIRAVLLFGIPSVKDAEASGAYAPRGHSAGDPGDEKDLSGHGHHHRPVCL
jgi:porphobilinogen synthase